MVAAFEGWNDAGEAASGGGRAPRGGLGRRPFAELDPEDYYDFQVNRPMVSSTTSGQPEHHLAHDPAVLGPAARCRAGRRAGPRASSRRCAGGAFGDEVARATPRSSASTTLVTLGALLADVPHTRPVPVTGDQSTTRGCMRRLALEPSTLRGARPASSASCRTRLRARGHPGAVALGRGAALRGAAASPKATLALLRQVEDLLDVTVAARRAARGRAGLGARRRRAGRGGRRGRRLRPPLEEAKDTADLPEASGEAIAREFERYLRRRDDGGTARG